MTEYQERMRALDLKIIGDIAKHGWSDMSIFPTKGHEGLPFNYTIGFKEREHPEVLMMGLPAETMHGVLGVVYQQVKSGTRFNPDTYYNFILNKHRVAFLEITDPMNNGYPMSMTKHLEGDFTAIQLVWPDEMDRFPWHSDFDRRLLDRQALLGPWRGDE